MASGLAELVVEDRTACATFEVAGSDPQCVHEGKIQVYVAFISNTVQELPEIGQTTVSIGLAPESSGTAYDLSNLNASFAELNTTRNAVLIRRCTRELLFPFVTNQHGFDTRIVIANTSLDPFGTTPQQGPVTFYFYGHSGAPAHEVSEIIPTLPDDDMRRTITKRLSPFATVKTPVISEGHTLVFSLSTGGEGMPKIQGFEGYVIAVTEFQYCFGSVLISHKDGRQSHTYLAVHLNRGGYHGSVYY
jgi:hypothetical protein